ncbi:MAG: hypothetical protein JNL45_01880 [Hyphomicrobium sp.]|nr:hypothetical protein [Hyphomicrobium sp.]
MSRHKSVMRAMHSCAAGFLLVAAASALAAEDQAPPPASTSETANTAAQEPAESTAAATSAQPAGKQDGKPDDKQDAASADGLTMEVFLDRLMRAESGGRTNARNPRSTALGPFQFIASTWLMIANKHFTKETEGLRVDQVLALRTDMALSRRAAQIYTHQNAAYLLAQGHKATYPNLRLAFLVGPGAAVRVLAAPADAAASTLLGGSVIAANPFMARLTAGGLITRAARDILADPGTLAGVMPDPALAAAGGSAGKRPAIAVPCELSLPSCRRWLALAQRRVDRKQRRASR